MWKFERPRKLVKDRCISVKNPLGTGSLLGRGCYSLKHKKHDEINIIKILLTTTSYLQSAGTTTISWSPYRGVFKTHITPLPANMGHCWSYLLYTNSIPPHLCSLLIISDHHLLIRIWLDDSHNPSHCTSSFEGPLVDITDSVELELCYVSALVCALPPTCPLIHSSLPFAFPSTSRFLSKVQFPDLLSVGWGWRGVKSWVRCFSMPDCCLQCVSVAHSSIM